MKKFLLAHVLLLASFTVAGVCEEHTAGSDSPYSGATLISTSQKVTDKDRMPRDVASTPPSVQCEQGFLLGVDFLYLFASEGGLDHARIRRTNIPSQTLIISAQRKWNQDFEFAPGVRVRLGRDLSYDRWDLFFDYTWYYTHPKTSMSAGDKEFIIPYNSIANDVISLVFKNGESDWRLRLHDGDINLGRHCRLGKRLNMHLFSGIKASWIGQNLGESYYNAHPTATMSTRDSSLKAKSRFLGVGPKLGFSSKWRLGSFLRGCSIDAGAYGALLCGKFGTNTHQSAERSEQATVKPLLVVTDFKDASFYRLRPMCYYRIGFTWECPVGGRCLLGLHLGWEAQYWWQQMAFFTAREHNVTDKDLSLMGGNFGVFFRF